MKGGCFKKAEGFRSLMARLYRWVERSHHCYSGGLPRQALMWSLLISVICLQGNRNVYTCQPVLCTRAQRGPALLGAANCL